MQKNVAGQKLIVYAIDSVTNLPKTGDAANITAYVSKDYGSVTILGDTSTTEMDATNAKGYYLFDLTQAETNADTLLFSAKSSTANVVVVGAPATVFTMPPNFSKQALSAAGGVTLADGVTHGGVPGSSTATLALQAINVTNPVGDAVLASSGGGSGSGLHCQSADGFGALFLEGTASGVPALYATAFDNAPAVQLSGGGSQAALLLGGGGPAIEAAAGSGGTGNYHGVLVQGRGTGEGIRVEGGNHGRGLALVGGASADATVYITGGSTGLRIESGGGPCVVLIPDAGEAVLVDQSANAGDFAGISIAGKGTGAGLSIAGGASGDGLDITGSAFGVSVTGGINAGLGVFSNDSDAVVLSAGTNGNGLNVQGGSASGLGILVNSLTNIGMTVTGFGGGVLFQCSGTGDGLQLQSAGGHDLDLIGDGKLWDGINNRPVSTNITHVNQVQVKGTGVSGNEWGPV